MFEIILRLILTIVWMALAIIMFLYFVIFKFNTKQAVLLLKDLIEDYKTVWQNCKEN